MPIVGVLRYFLKVFLFVLVHREGTSGQSIFCVFPPVALNKDCVYMDFSSLFCFMFGIPFGMLSHLSLA